MTTKPNVWIPCSVVLGKSLEEQIQKIGTKQIIFPAHVRSTDFSFQETLFRESVLEWASGDDFLLTMGPNPMVAHLTALFVKSFGKIRFLCVQNDMGKKQIVERRFTCQT